MAGSALIMVQSWWRGMRLQMGKEKERIGAVREEGKKEIGSRERRDLWTGKHRRQKVKDGK